jgi:flagellar basal body-associated protein FliL
MQKQDPEEQEAPDNERAPISLTRISVPLVAGIVAIVAILSWTYTAWSQYSSMREENTARYNSLAKEQAAGFAELAKQVREVTFKIELQEAHKGEYYTIAEHRRFVLELLRLNPTLKLPENQ